MLANKLLNPYYVKANNNVSAAFILSVLFCSKIESFERNVIYIFYMCNIIPHDLLKYDREKLDKAFLLQLIFEHSANKKFVPKKDLRALTGLEDKSTFNKYFDEHLNNLGLSVNRAFTLKETYAILQFWQGDDKWGRMEAFSKGELAKRFMNGNYAELEKQMVDNILDYNNYYHHDYIKPADAKKFINNVLDKDSISTIYEEDFSADYLSFFFIVFFLYAFKTKKKKVLN